MLGYESMMYGEEDCDSKITNFCCYSLGASVPKSLISQPKEDVQKTLQIDW